MTTSFFGGAFFGGEFYNTEVVVQSPAALPGGGSSKRKKRPRYWWEKEEEKELEIPYVPPQVQPPKPVRIYLAPDITPELMDVDLKVTTQLKRKKRIKRLALIAALIDE